MQRESQPCSGFVLPQASQGGGAPAGRLREPHAAPSELCAPTAFALRAREQGAAVQRGPRELATCGWTAVNEMRTPRGHGRVWGPSTRALRQFTVSAPALCVTSAWARFHGDALLSDSGGKGTYFFLKKCPPLVPRPIPCSSLSLWKTACLTARTHTGRTRLAKKNDPSQQHERAAHISTRRHALPTAPLLPGSQGRARRSQLTETHDARPGEGQGPGTSPHTVRLPRRHGDG